MCCYIPFSFKLHLYHYRLNDKDFFFFIGTAGSYTQITEHMYSTFFFNEQGRPVEVESTSLFAQVQASCAGLRREVGRLHNSDSECG